MQCVKAAATQPVSPSASLLATPSTQCISSKMGRSPEPCARRADPGRFPPGHRTAGPPPLPAVCLHPPKGTAQDTRTPGRTRGRLAGTHSTEELTSLPSGSSVTVPRTGQRLTHSPSCRALGTEAPELVIRCRTSVASVGIPEILSPSGYLLRSRGRVWGRLDTDTRLVMTLY